MAGSRVVRSCQSCLGHFWTIFWIFGDTNRPKHGPRNRQRRRSGRRSTPHATLRGLLSSPICRTLLAIVGLVRTAAGSNRPVWAVSIGFSPRRQLQVGICCSTTISIYEAAITSAASSILVVYRMLLLLLLKYSMVLVYPIILPYPIFSRRQKFKKMIQIQTALSQQQRVGERRWWSSRDL